MNKWINIYIQYIEYIYMKNIEIMIVVLDSWLVSRIPKPPTQTNKNF